MFFFPILIVALAAASVMNTHACQKGKKKDFFYFYSISIIRSSRMSKQKKNLVENLKFMNMTNSFHFILSIPYVLYGINLCA